MGELQRRLDLRAEVEARHLEDVELYTRAGGSCRRVRLLSHFGDSAAELVAPCDGCDVCREAAAPRAAGGPGPSVRSLIRRLLGALRPGRAA